MSVKVKIMLPEQPKFHSAEPVMVFNGQRHQAVLLSHLRSTGPRRYDSLLMVNQTGQREFCSIVALESEGAGQPLSLAVYGDKGRQILQPEESQPCNRENFLSYALFIVEQVLQDRLVMPAPSKSRPVIEENR